MAPRAPGPSFLPLTVRCDFIPEPHGWERDKADEKIFQIGFFVFCKSVKSGYYKELNISPKYKYLNYL